jgi:prepilin-type N-terminal cleavage/methylation domain-containing protein
MKRAISLIEILVVLAIVGLLAAILFPVFASAKKRAKESACHQQLKQVAQAMLIYRGDFDGRGIVWEIGKGTRYPLNSFQSLESYLKPGTLVWCVQPSENPMILTDFYQWRYFRTGEAEMVADRHFQVSPSLDSTQVVVHCGNHANGAPMALSETDWMKSNLRKGLYLFARGDTSLGRAMSSEIEAWYFKQGIWSQTPDYSGKSQGFFRFPKENWPPEPEF